MSNSGLSAPASPDPDLSGSSSRPESRSSISSNSMVDQAAESTSRLSSNLDELNEVEAKSESGEVIGLDENAQSGGLLERHKDKDTNDFKMDREDSLEMVSDDDMEANDSCKGPPTRKSPIIMDPLKDTELDFEEDVTEEVKSENRVKRDEDEEGECGDKTLASGDGSQDEVEEGEELEEGEVSSEEDVGKHARMEPRPVCRFYSKGNCTWGNNCRFVHPGVLDKGNYNMFAPTRSSGHNNGPSGGYERPFDRPPVTAPMPPAEWASSGPRAGINPRPPMRHPQALEPPRADAAAAGSESAWERGLRQAKEMLKKSNHRKETDVDFEEKKLNLGIGEEELDKENDYYTRPASPALHGDVPPPFEEPEVDPYNKYPTGAAEGRWPRYPPQRHPPPPPHGYPYPPYEPRRSFVNEPEFRERDFYNHDGYDRHYYAHKTGGDREGHSSSKKPQPPLPPPPEKRWQEERDRYVEMGPAATQRGRGDEWWDPWMRSRSPGGGAGSTANPGAAKESRRRSYSSGSSFSTSSSTSSSSSSSYSSSSQSSSRSSGSSRSSFRSKAINAKRRALRKNKVSDKVKTGKMSTSQSATNKHKVQQTSAASTGTFPPSPPNHPTVRKITAQKPRNVTETSPTRNRGWSTSSSRSRSRSPSSKHRSAAPKNNSLSQPNKSRGRSRSSSDSSSSSEWESSPHSNDNGRSRRSNRGRRDFAERKELRGGATPPSLPPLTSIKGKTSEPPKVAEVKQQIKLTLKSTVPQLKKVANKFNDDSDDEDPLAWEKNAPSDIPPLTPVTSQNQLSRKRAAESPPPAPPPSKVAVSSPQKTEKGSSKKSAATRREELLKQLKAVEEAIARKRSKLPT